MEKSLFGFILGQNLVQNGSFDQGHDTIPVGSPQTFSTLPGWTTQPGSEPLDVVRDGYFGISDHADNTGYWLDTQGSFGGIDITQNINIPVPTIHGLISNKLSFDISAENLDGLLKTAPDHHFQMIWDNHIVADITTAQLGDYNHFHHIDLAVAGNLSGINTLEIRDIGGTPNNVGFAVTNIDVHQEITILGIGVAAAHNGLPGGLFV